MKKCVVYYSMSGNTEKVALKIKERTDCDLVRLTPKDPYPDKGLKKFLWGGKSALMAEYPELEAYDFDASKYDTVIFGTPVWASCFTPPLRTFVSQNKEDLKTKKTAAYVCYMGSGAASAMKKLNEILGDSLEKQLILKDSQIDSCENEIDTFLQGL